jgi:molybdopterin synthase sulfur carrier subunit
MPLVKFFAGLRKTAGTKEMHVNAPNLRAVLDQLTAQFPPFQEQVWDGQALGSHIVITINGHTLDPLESLDSPVLPEDEIAIFPPIAGG